MKSQPLPGEQGNVSGLEWNRRMGEGTGTGRNAGGPEAGQDGKAKDYSKAADYT